MTKNKTTRLIADLKEARNFVRIAPLFAMIQIDKVLAALEAELERNDEPVRDAHLGS